MVVLERLDRLTQEEARTTAAETLKVIYGLIQEMSEQAHSACKSVDCWILFDHLDGITSGDGVHESLGMFHWQWQASSVSDWALEMLHQVLSDINKLKHQLFFDFAFASWNDIECLAGDKLQQDIWTWLSPPNPWKNYNVACGSCHIGTGTWFVQGEMFSKWKSSGPNTLLWIHGKR